VGYFLSFAVVHTIALLMLYREDVFLVSVFSDLLSLEFVECAKLGCHQRSCKQMPTERIVFIINNPLFMPEYFLSF
jgi:hypothetical protein